MKAASASAKYPAWLFLAMGVGLCALMGDVAQATAPPGRYAIANGGTANGTVYDVVTQLVWQQTLSTATYTWSSTNATGSAQAYCASQNGLALGGFNTGWRLPTVNELLSIVDFSTSSSAIDLNTFPTTPGNHFWTATPYVFNNNTSAAWVVYFVDGNSDFNAVGTPNSVRCVR